MFQLAVFDKYADEAARRSRRTSTTATSSRRSRRSTPSWRTCSPTPAARSGQLYHRFFRVNDLADGRSSSAAARSTSPTCACRCCRSPARATCSRRGRPCTTSPSCCRTRPRCGSRPRPAATSACSPAAAAAARRGARSTTSSPTPTAVERRAARLPAAAGRDARALAMPTHHSWSPVPPRGASRWPLCRPSPVARGPVRRPPRARADAPAGVTAGGVGPVRPDRRPGRARARRRAAPAGQDGADRRRVAGQAGSRCDRQARARRARPATTAKRGRRPPAGDDRRARRAQPPPQAVRSWVVAIAARLGVAPRNATVRIRPRSVRLRPRAGRAGAWRPRRPPRPSTSPWPTRPAASARCARSSSRSARPSTPTRRGGATRPSSRSTSATLHAAALQALQGRQALRRRRRPAGLPDALGPVRDPEQAGQPGLVGAEQPVGGRAAGQTVAGRRAANPLKARWMGIANGVGIHGTGRGLLDRHARLARLHPHARLRRDRPVPARPGRHAGPPGLTAVSAPA